MSERFLNAPTLRSHRDIAAILGISSVRVSQLERQAIRKLRRVLANDWQMRNLMRDLGMGVRRNK